jgi:hypothetical protein
MSEGEKTSIPTWFLQFLKIIVAANINNHFKLIDSSHRSKLTVLKPIIAKFWGKDSNGTELGTLEHS